MKELKFHLLWDHQDCTKCGKEHEAYGADIYLEGKLIRSLKPEANCDGVVQTWYMEDIYQEALDALGYDFVFVHTV